MLEILGIFFGAAVLILSVGLPIIFLKWLWRKIK